MDNKINIKYIIAGIIIIWLLSAISLYLFFENPADRGTFGDMFGAVNALFSGLALAGVIYTIFLQSKELSLQRLELQQTRGVFEKQQFESTFFQLLNLQQNNLNEIDVQITIKTNGKITKEITKIGQNALLDFSKELNKNYIRKSMNESKIVDEKLKLNMKKYFEIDMSNNFTIYFNTLSNVVDFAFKSNHSDKGFYLRLISNQLSPIEKYYLFHHLQTKIDLADTYLNMTKDIPEKLFVNKNHYEFYLNRFVN